jgi:hypothetical protein
MDMKRGDPVIVISELHSSPRPVNSPHLCFMRSHKQIRLGSDLQPFRPSAQITRALREVIQRPKLNVHILIAKDLTRLNPKESGSFVRPQFAQSAELQWLVGPRMFRRRCDASSV